MEAQLPAVHEQWDEVERRARDLAGSTTSKTWRRCARLLLAYSLECQGRCRDALDEVSAVAEESGSDRMTCFDQACLHGFLGEGGAFFKFARRFAGTPATDCETEDWLYLVQSRSERVASGLGLSRREVIHAFGFEDSE